MPTRVHARTPLLSCLLCLASCVVASSEENVSQICGKEENRAIVSANGLCFRVPEPWYHRPQDIPRKFHLTRAKLDAAKDGEGEWSDRLGGMCNKLLPFKHCVAHASPWNWPRGGRTLQVRAYLLDDEWDKAYKRVKTLWLSELERLGVENPPIDVSQVGEWKAFPISTYFFYWDYGGMANLDCYLRAVDGKVIAMAFMYSYSRANYSRTIRSILDSVELLDKKTAAELRSGRATAIPGAPIIPPPEDEKDPLDREIDELTDQLKQKPMDVDLLVKRAELLEVAGGRNSAINDYTAALRLAPDNKAIGKALAAARKARGANGVPWGSKKSDKYKQLLADLNHALEWDAKDSGAYYFRGGILSSLGQYDRAIADYDASIRLRPNNAAVYSFRGLAKMRRGDDKNALADLNRAIELEPSVAWWLSHRVEYWLRRADYARAVEDLAKVRERGGESWKLVWLLASCPDPDIRDPERALTIAKEDKFESSRHILQREALAAAHAAVGQFAEAVRLQSHIWRYRDKKESPKSKKRLELYEAKKPFVFGKDLSSILDSD